MSEDSPKPTTNGLRPGVLGAVIVAVALVAVVGLLRNEPDSDDSARTESGGSSSETTPAGRQLCNLVTDEHVADAFGQSAEQEGATGTAACEYRINAGSQESFDFGVHVRLVDNNGSEADSEMAETLLEKVTPCEDWSAEPGGPDFC